MKSFKNSAFARFFTNFPKIMFANLLYTIPSTICFAIFGLIGYLTGFQNVIVWFLGIIPAYPLYAGLVMVIRKIAVEKEDINVLDTFKTSVKPYCYTFSFRNSLLLFNGFCQCSLQCIAYTILIL